MGVFAVYQALPDSMVPSRNNKLIYEQIGPWFTVNMIVNGLWLMVFQQNQVWGFAVGLIGLVVILATARYIMHLSTTATVDVWEWIGLRAGFSIYAGWVTAATILNATYLFKSLGLSDTGALANIS